MKMKEVQAQTGLSRKAIAYYQQKGLIEPVVEEIRTLFAGHVYGVDVQDLHHAVLSRLGEQNKTIAVAESCTGGTIASRLTDIPGASQVFLCGAVTYSNVWADTPSIFCLLSLEEHGAVSPECALEMARGMRGTSGADFALATTGIAGPDGGTPEKPVGLAYLALAYEGGEEVHELRLVGNRERIRGTGVLEALDMLRRRLENI